MQIGMIGLGRMGANIARRLMRHGHACVVYDRDPEPGRSAGGRGRDGSGEPRPIWCKALAAPRAVWVMLPAGAATEAAIAELGRLLAAGDTIIDGGNTFWKDDIRRAARAEGEGHPLSRRRHVRRRVGARARLLPDDRRRQGGRRAARSDLRRAGAGQGRHPRHAPAARGAIARAEQGYLHAGPERRRPLRQDDPQRHRVRHDAGDRRGLRHPEERRLAAAAGGAAARHRRCRHRRGVAARQRHHLLAARPHRRGAGRGRRRWPAIRATWRTPARAAGPCRRPSRRRCRPRC